MYISFHKNEITAIPSPVLLKYYHCGLKRQLNNQVGSKLGHTLLLYNLGQHESSACRLWAEESS